MIVVVVMLVLLMIVVMMVLVLLMIMVMMMFMLMLLFCQGMLCTHLLQQLLRQGYLLNGGENHLAVQLIPGSGEDGGIGILLPQHGHRGLQLLLAELLGAGENDGSGGLHLVVVELAEVLHIDLDLGGIHHSGKAVELELRHVGHGIFHRHNHVAELAHAGGLNEDAVGMELRRHIPQRLIEIAHQRAADASGGHLRNLHAGLLQKAAVNADLAELIFNQDQLLAGERLRQQFFNEGRLARTQKAGNNVDFCHAIKSFALNFLTAFIIPSKTKNATASRKNYRTFRPPARILD